MNPEDSKQYDYPVQIANDHVAFEGVVYEGDKFICYNTGGLDVEAYTHTGAWPAFNYCPFCGMEL